MFTFNQFLRYVMKVVPKRRPKPNPYRLVKRVRVLDNEINRNSTFWKLYIGQEGILLGAVVEDQGEMWDVKLDSQPIPNPGVMKERFELLPSLAEKEHHRNDPAV